MPLQLTARPTVVARETLRPDGSHLWLWSLNDDEKAVLRTMVQNGAAGTAQGRRGDQLVLLAWDVAAQQEAARAVAEARKQELRKEGLVRVVRRPQAVPRAGPTHFPYAYEPARW